MKKKILAILIGCTMIVGCSASNTESISTTENDNTFVYGTTGYGIEMGNEGLNPHSNYSGWSCVRYGVGETLFKFSDSMEAEPWLATGYEFVDNNTVAITLRDNVYFSSGRLLDGIAVKECLDDLIAVHDRAPRDLKIDSIEAEGQRVTIHTTEPCPAIINYLCDPYGAIIDMEYGIQSNNNVAGTGPYIATAVSDTEISLIKNNNYWNGDVSVENVVVKSITDGDTLTMALQSGEVNATYGLPYASYSLFENNDYNINSCATSRTFFAQMNYRSNVLQDDNVRRAIAMSIDKNSFVETLLDGHGAVAVGPFPDSFTFGDNSVNANGYDPEGARTLLSQSGWVDSDSDGYVDKNGENLTIRWLTYPGRQELPLLAESVQATLKDIGIKVDVNCTADHLSILETGNFDVYASALVTAPTGDPEYFFTTCALDSSAKNVGFYHNDELQVLAEELHSTFDTDKRSELATKMQQIILNDNAQIFASHLQMSIVSQSKVSGLVAHPCDYYEITANLKME